VSNNIEKFRVGDKVRVIDNSLLSYGLIGTIKAIDLWESNTFVRFEDWHEQGEKTLLISKSKLAKITEEENMNDRSSNVMNVSGNYEVAMVKFVQGTNTTREYAFALFDKEVCVGDIVLCDTCNGYGVAKVVSIIPQNEFTGVVTKEIVCIVDFTDFNNRKELRKKKEALKKQMDELVHKNQELILYKAIAEKNPEMAEMLKEYMSLNNV
jgi:hypothetical protein